MATQNRLPTDSIIWAFFCSICSKNFFSSYSSSHNNGPTIFSVFSALAVWKPGSFGYLWQVALALINTLQDYYYNQPFIKQCRVTTTAWLFDLFNWELICWSKLGRSKVMIALPDMKVILSWFNIDKINSRSWKKVKLIYWAVCSRQ